MRKLRLSFLFVFLFIFLCLHLAARFAIYGDTRSNPEIHRQIVQQIVSHHPEATFHLGDLNSFGLAQKEYDNFLQIIAPLNINKAFYPARGNHEKDLNLFLKNFPYLKGSSYYTIYADSIRFIILDSVLDLSPGSEQYRWLQKQLLERTPSLLLLHHPIFSSGEHSDELGLQLFLPELLKNSSVKAVFSAHDHNYERSEYKGITYIVSGGGGAPLREEDNPNPYSQLFIKGHNYLIGDRIDGKVVFNVYDIEGKPLDTFTLLGF
ncbi:MAG: metallophosphoesterase [Candidatus Cloacimonas sp.]